MRAAALLALALRLAALAAEDRCSSIIVGRKASASGATMTSHTNDCLNCDFRISKVPAADHEEGAQRTISADRAAYPRWLGEGRGDTYLPENTDLSIYPWAPGNGSFRAIGSIPEVEHTYAYVDGAYGIINEHQLAIGESTCGALLQAKSVANGGAALLDTGTLTRIAMQRCKTARCAITTIGALAEAHGFHGDDETPAEGGESLQIADPEEAWVFHILADDTGTSAVWAAQRVPDDHIAMVANAFIIRTLDLDDADNFMASDNVEKVARRAGLWPRPAYECDKAQLAREASPGQCPMSDAYDGAFDFTAAYGLSRGPLFSPYASRRVWRVFTLAAPSMAAELPAETNVFADDYPFSVRPDQPLEVEDIFRMLRDHYEGTPYDMTKGLAAGPYGDPARWDPGATDGVYPDAGEGLSAAEATSGAFERAISLYRASYGWVSQSRRAAPGLGHIWFGQYAPHASQFLPVYALAAHVPAPLARGSLLKYDPGVQYWAHASVANYAARFYVHTIGDIQDLQAAEEARLRKLQAGVEERAAEALSGGDGATARAVLQKFQDDAAERDVRTWTAFFHHMLAKYKDGQRIDDFHAESLSPTKLFFPKSWLRAVGFFRNAYFPHGLRDVDAAAAGGHHAKHAHGGHAGEAREGSAGGAPSPQGHSSAALGLAVGLALAAGVVAGRRWASPRGGYEALPN